jgi:Ni/Co efflux regulator RcnB
MNPVRAVFAILALIIPAGAVAQPQDRDQIIVAAVADSEAKGWTFGQDSGRAPLVLAREVRGYRGRGYGPRSRVYVGPRGQLRTFSYRGRNLYVIRRPAFIYPRGYGYRRWAVGNLLPAALIAAPFLFLEYDALGLRPPPPGYRWVRYGPDVLLVNERTREVGDAAYDAIDDE